MNIRSFKPLSFVFIILMFVELMACSPSSSNSQNNLSQDSSKENSNVADEIIIGRLSDAAYLDPNQPMGGNEVTILQNIYEGLVTNSEDNSKIVGQLATDWEIKDDGLTYVFNLKPDLKFSDGTPVKGEDWVWSLIRARDCETSAYRFIAEAIKDVESDGKTVTIHLKEQWAPFLADLCNFNMVVQSKEHFEKVGEEEYSRQPLGTGPYMLKEWKKEEYIALEKNPYYHIEGLPVTKNLKFTVIADDNTRLMQLQAGQIDIINDVPYSLVDMVKADKNLQIKQFPSTQARFLEINVQHPPLDNVKVRKALIQAIDKDELAQVVTKEFGAPAAALIPETEGKWHNSDIKPLKYDPELAKSMLAEAGYPDGIDVEIIVRSGNAVYEQIATLLKSQWAKAGINCNILLLERAALSEKNQSLNFQLCLGMWLDDILDPSGITGWAIDYAQSSAWYTGLDDKELQELNAKASREMDEAKRIEMYWEIQRRVIENANVTPLFKNDFVWACSNKIQNLDVTPFAVLRSSKLSKVK